MINNQLITPQDISLIKLTIFELYQREATHMACDDFCSRSSKSFSYYEGHIFSKD